MPYNRSTEHRPFLVVVIVVIVGLLVKTAVRLTEVVVVLVQTITVVVRHRL